MSLCRALKSFMLFAAGLAAVYVEAADYNLKKAPRTIADWKNGEFYGGGVAPQGTADDIINSPDDVTISVDGCDDELMRFLSSFKVIYLKAGSRLSVTVPSEKVATLGCAVRFDSSNQGYLEKNGPGELALTAWRKLNPNTDSPDDYSVNIHVKEGVLRLPDTSKSQSKCYNMFGTITVDEGAKLISVTKSIFQVRGFDGGGVITNECDSECTIYVTQHWLPKKPFYGELGGKFKIHLRQKCYLDLAGRNNSYVNSESIGLYGEGANSVALVSYFGETEQENSSIGKGKSISFSSGMRMVYTGEGDEKTYKKIYALNSPSYLDAGANGGVEFAGDFATWSTSYGNLQRVLVLDGSNLNECVISGKFDPNNFCSSNGTTNQWYIIKRGTGSWRFTADDHNHLIGTFAVENGVLAFDSILQKGLACALGKSTRTYPYHIGDLSAVNPHEYAFELGSATNSSWTGLMEYRGSDAAQCLDRPFALLGTGGFLANAGAGRIKYANIKGVGAGEKTLVLDGDSLLTNSLYNVADGGGVVSVSKRGSGVWLLGGDVDISGDVEVLGGTLIVRREPQHYTRYRFTLKEIADENDEFRKLYHENWPKVYGFWCFNEIGLYDENGYRQNFYLEGCSNWAALQPGEAAFATDKTVTANEPAKMTIARLFDGVKKVVLPDGSEVWNGFVGYIDSLNPPNRNREDSWISIDMYLTNGAPRITHYDINNSGISKKSEAGGRTASAFSLYGSVDGVNWDLLSGEFDSISDVPAGTYYWLYNLKSYDDNSDPSPSTRHTDGWKLKKTIPDRVFKVFEDIGTVTVANGGELKFEGEGAPEISSLKLTVGETGAIEGFSFAENGELEISGEVPDEGLFIPVSFNGSLGFSNIKAWSLRINAQAAVKVVRVNENGLMLLPKGLALSVR